MGKKNKNKKKLSSLQPKVSILTPTFRRTNFLPLLFDCIQKQDYSKVSIFTTPSDFISTI